MACLLQYHPSFQLHIWAGDFSSLGVVSWSLNDFLLSYLTNEKLRLLELWSFVQGEIATRGQSQWCV